MFGRQKRIEHRGKYLRASRTGGVSLRAQTKAAGLTVTGNTKRGVRVSTRIARGTNVALQNGRFRLRGRYGKGPTKKGEGKIQEAKLDGELSSATSAKAALFYAVSTWGRGLSAEDVAADGVGPDGPPAAGRETAAPEAVGPAPLDQLIEPGKPRREAEQMRQVTAAFAGRYAAGTSREEVGETFLELDEAAREKGIMTKLQEKLIDIYADMAHPLFAEAKGTTSGQRAGDSG